MSKFNECPKLVFEECRWYNEEKCEGCPIYTAYYIGRADVICEMMKEMRNGKE